jgi:hypothetical protein
MDGFQWHLARNAERAVLRRAKGSGGGLGLSLSGDPVDASLNDR